MRISCYWYSFYDIISFTCHTWAHPEGLPGPALEAPGPKDPRSARAWGTLLVPPVLARFLEWVWDLFWIDFGVLLGAFSRAFSSTFAFQKTHQLLDRFRDVFRRDFGTPKPPKWSSRLYETLILTKSPFSLLEAF